MGRPTDHTILVIEDNEDHALLVRIAARRALPGLDVRVAGDGEEGIAYLAGLPPFHSRDAHPFPDLVLLDLVMPRVDGFHVLEWARDEGVLEQVPVVVFTSSVNPGDEERALALGAREFVTKPSDLDELERVVRELVDRWVRA